MNYREARLIIYRKGILTKSTIIDPMNNKQRLQNKITELESELQSFKQQLGNYKEITIENAVPGDVLEDGSIVVDKQGSIALLAAPVTTEVCCKWSKEFSGVFAALKSQGLNPSQWFIPTKEQLGLARTNCKQHFASDRYWSSTEVSSTSVCFLRFFNGFISSSPKSSSGCVRAFRCVSF
jgi:hypothetical protein